MAYILDEVEDIERLPRNLAIIAGLRKLSPTPDRIPNHTVEVEPIDTGGTFRPDWRMQAPDRDPKEPYGNESNSDGTDHAWSNCTMVSAALVYAYHVKDKSGPQGGDMRHNQDDREGGTDLYDAKTAWDRYGNQTLSIRSGQGWGAVKQCHNEGRAILIQGEGNVPGDESFDGSHACVIGIETNSDGKWLWGDPLASGWQWVPPSKIEDWAKNLSSGILFAVSKVVTTPPPEPEPQPPKPPEVITVGAVDTEYVEDAAVAAYQSELLREMTFWLQNPSGTPPFPVSDAIEVIKHPNEGWGIGKWNQTNWYLSPTAGRWNEAKWAGIDSSGGVWA
jgi:hypothetical protein